MRLLVLYTRLSGYIVACLNAFKSKARADIMLYAWPNSGNAPFENSLFKNFKYIRYSDGLLLEDVNIFNPHAVLVSGWIDKRYLNVCRRLKKLGIPIVSGFDTQWNNSLRQNFARLISPFYLHQYIDVLWGCGNRQQIFAKKLGYSQEKYWDGFYSCDWEKFAKFSPEVARNKKPQQFLYVGRLVQEKGIESLVDAYLNYRTATDSPWPLAVVGKGPLKHLLIHEGIQVKGFIQPRDLPALMQSATVLILPSLFEPWGVVVHEATSSKLPLILSDACGSGDHLLQHQKNGFKFKAGSIDDLTEAMLTMHNLTDTELQMFGEQSFELSKQYSPKRWAETLYRGLKQWS